MTSFLQQIFVRLNTTASTGHPVRTHRRRPQAAPTGADWLALARPSPDRDRTVYDPTGAALALKKSDVLAHGGEGIVYTFRKNPAFLIKICKDDTLRDPRKLAAFRDRLNAMLALEECRKADFLAWPLMSVFDEKKQVIGFVMRKNSGRTLRALYAPCQVRRFFPGWDRLSVTCVALNLVNAVQMLARHRVLVNDFNPDNFLVDSFGRIRLIDCDSFQIPGAGDDQNTFLTRTFTPEYTAPELLFHPELFNRERTPEQVRFSLAVVVYMILMSGLHPYAQCGGGDPVENLKSGKCPLARRDGVRLPVGWYKSVSWLTPGLKHLFIRMFVDGHHEPLKRPMLGELKSELENFIDVMRKSKNKNQRAILPEKVKRKEKVV
jgi:DNA-binding helix-hairpin-helix protein with protein kinase domain